MTSAVSSSGVLIGQILDQRYRLERFIGEGAMGHVFAARDIDSGLEVAIKLLRPHLLGDSLASERFRREIKATMSLSCEHIARTIEVGHLDSGVPFMVMEYCEGIDVAKAIANLGPLPVARAVDLALQVCVALAHAHRIGIIHRDIKPANLVVIQDAFGRELVKVLDFGISRFKPRENATLPLSLTLQSARLGSPLYVSPEQKAFAAEADERSDIWSLGVTLFEMIAGTVPFDASPEPLSDRNEPLTNAPSLSRYRTDVPKGLENTVGRCLQRSPQHRFQTVAELAMALAPFASPRVVGLAYEVTRIVGVPQLQPMTPATNPAEMYRSVVRYNTEIAPTSTLGPSASICPESREPGRFPWAAFAITCGAVAMAVLLVWRAKAVYLASDQDARIERLRAMSLSSACNCVRALSVIKWPKSPSREIVGTEVLSSTAGSGARPDAGAGAGRASDAAPSSSNGPDGDGSPPVNSPTGRSGSTQSPPLGSASELGY